MAIKSSIAYFYQSTVLMPFRFSCYRIMVNDTGFVCDLHLVEGLLLGSRVPRKSTWKASPRKCIILRHPTPSPTPCCNLCRMKVRNKLRMREKKCLKYSADQTAFGGKDDDQLDNSLSEPREKEQASFKLQRIWTRHG